MNKMKKQMIGEENPEALAAYIMRKRSPVSKKHIKTGLEGAIDRAFAKKTKSSETIASQNTGGRGYFAEIRTHPKYGVVFYNVQDASWAEYVWQKDHCVHQIVKKKRHYIVGSAVPYKDALKIAGFSEFTSDNGRDTSCFAGRRIDKIFGY